MGGAGYILLIRTSSLIKIRRRLCGIGLILLVTAGIQFMYYYSISEM